MNEGMHIYIYVCERINVRTNLCTYVSVCK